MSLRESLRSLAWLAIGLCVAAGAAFWQASYNKSLAETRFDAMSRRAAEQVAARMHAFEYGLRGARGAVIAAGGEAGIARLRFAQYSASQDIEREFPGSSGFGFVRRLPTDQEADFIAAARLDGKPDFHLHQLGPNEGERFVIQYFEPSDSAVPAIGLDLASEPRRRAAAERAMRSGEIAMTAPITLVQSSPGPRSVLLLLPIYRIETPLDALKQRDRRSLPARGTHEQTIGWIYTPVVPAEVLKDFDFEGGQFAIRLADATDGGEPDPFFVSPQQPAAAGALRNQLALELYGRSWKVDVAATPQFLKQLDLRSPLAGVPDRRHSAQTVRDITHEKATKARILELNATLDQQVGERTAQLVALSTRQRAILADAASAIIATDVDGVVTLFNPAAEALLGYAAAEVVDRFQMVRFHDPAEVRARAEALAAELGRPLRSGEVFAHAEGGFGAHPREWTWVRKDGRRLPVHLNVSPLRDDVNAVVGFIAIGSDLSERKLAEEKLRSNERFMRIVTDNIPGIVAYWTTDMRCTFANSAYQRWLGRTAEQMVGTTQLELLGPAQFGSNEPHMRAALAGQEQRVMRTRTLADGSIAHYWLHYIPDRDEAGVVQGCISVAVDVTDMRRAQEQLEVLNLALNERSAQAESASRAKSEFLANMSHEIRSPLNAVIGLAYLLRQTRLDDTQRDFLQKIDAASSALLGVINDILDISKIEAGEMALDESGFRLQELLDGVMAMASVNAGGKDIALRLELEDGLPAQLRGDQTRLRQILVNLMSNAVKFTAEGAVRLCVTLEEQQGRQLRLRFAVIDTGIGIEAQVLERIFAPFTQADTSTTRRFGGTGLGLSIVKQLAELMGGEVGVASTPGQGSDFWVVLPLEIADDVAATAPAPDLAAIRVLVVDDSPVNLLVCQNILARAGAEVSLAKDGREAVEKLRADPAAFDVVLMDVHMPVLDGNAATRLIRGELGLVALPVIALTASALVAERLRAFEAGMNDFVSKPFDAEVLMRTVRRCVERGRAGEATGLREDAAPSAAAPAPAPSALRPEDLAALIEALRERSASALPRLDELGPALRAHLGEQRFGALERALQTLRLRRAAEILEGADAGGQARNL